MKHCFEGDSSFVKELVRAVIGCNVLLHCTNERGNLSTTRRRASYFMKEFPVVMNAKYSISRANQDHVYIPIIEMLQKLLNKKEVFDDVPASSVTLGNYSSYTHIIEIIFFCRR